MKNIRPMILVAAICALLITSIAVIGRSTGGTPADSNDDTETITMIIPTYGYTSEDTEKVFRAMNRYSRQMCGVQVDFQQMNVEEVANNAGLKLRAGEQIDLFPCMEGDIFQEFISDGLLAPLDDLLETEGKGILDIVPEEVWPSMESDGKIYGVSALMLPTVAEGLILRKDVSDDIQLDPAAVSEKVMNEDDAIVAIDEQLTPVFTEIQDSGTVLANGTALKDLKLISGRNGYGGLFSECQLLDADGFGNTLGTVLGESGQVVNLYETDAYLEMVQLIRKWAEMGLIYVPDTLSDDNARILLGEGKGLGYFSATQVLGETIIPSEGNASNGQVRISLHKRKISTQFMQIGEWTIPTSSAHKEAAMKILNLMFTDKDYVTLFDRGIEGEHYEILNGELQTLTDRYFQNFDWLFGNILLLDENMTSQKLNQAFHEADYSPYYGFSYDGSRYSREIAAMEAVLADTIPSLETGQTEDPETAIAQMNARLHDLGLDEVMEDKQTQLDKYLLNQQTHNGTGYQ